MEILLRRSIQGLAPADQDAEEGLKKIALGTDVRVKLTIPKNPRSIRQHRWYWKLCQVVQENTDGAFKNAEEVSDYLKIQAGHCDRRYIKVPDENGALETMVWLQPRSISFTNMGQSEFHEYTHQAMDIICARIIPGMDKKQLEREIEELVQ